MACLRLTALHASSSFIRFEKSRMNNPIAQLLNALASAPRDPALHYEIGSRYLSEHQYAQANTYLQQALTLAPKHPQILMQLGNVAFAQQDFLLAKQYFSQSVQVDSSQGDVHYNLANTLRALGELAQAIHHFQCAIQRNPSDADYYNNLGNALREQGLLDQAVVAYTHAMRLNPQLLHAKVHWIHQKQQMADWQGLAPAIAQVRTALSHDHQAQIPPFAFMAMPGTTDAEQTLCASMWAQVKYGQYVPFSNPAPRNVNSLIKIAYLSSDFRPHPLASLITEVIAAHRRSHFEVYLYSQAAADESLEQTAFKAAADHWVEIATLTDLEIAQHMRHANIDIVVDLTGYTQNSRTGVVAYRPARLHVNWLGFPGSMGHLHGKPLFDAIVVDKILNMPHLAEKAIVLPCYQPNNAKRRLDDAGTRADHGLPAHAFVFFCFNQSFKITPEVFSHWMTILQSVPNSVLWLLATNQWSSQQLQTAAKAANIDPNRLIFAPRLALEAHIARQQHADLMLDTLPYNAHTTASDALRAGVPILTVLGDTFSSRVSASLLNHIGLPALICQDWQSYCAEAIRLATDPNVLAEIKAKLQHQTETLFNPTQFVRQLEAALSAALHANNL